MKALNAENQALNDKPFNDELRELIASIVEPAKGLLVNTAGTGESAPAIEPPTEAE